jgi:membrane protease YdiL (CAAX protease family)
VTEYLAENPAQVENGRDPRWTEQLVELAVFLLIILPPNVIYFYMYFFKIRGAWAPGLGDFRLFAISSICSDFGLVGLICFFLWRNGEPFQTLGWNFNKGWRDIGLGFLIYSPFILMMVLWKTTGSSVHLKTLSFFLAAGAKVRGELLLAFLLVVVTALSEEIIFRGYLILRLKAITASSGTAVWLSAVVFALGHGWKGAAGVIGAGLVGLLYGAVFLRRQSLVAPITMHFIADMGIILIPLFG